MCSAALGGVDEVVVIGVAAPGRDEEIVRAVVACSTGRLAHEDVLAWCRPRLAEHKVPRSIVIVDAIPRTARGKVDRAALLEADLPYLADPAGRGPESIWLGPVDRARRPRRSRPSSR